jgi:hypothetical protein
MSILTMSAEGRLAGIDHGDLVMLDHRAIDEGVAGIGGEAGFAVPGKTADEAGRLGRRRETAPR